MPFFTVCDPATGVSAIGRLGGRRERNVGKGMKRGKETEEKGSGEGGSRETCTQRERGRERTSF